MANQIRLKRASGSDPGASDLVLGEPAVRTDTGEIFLKKDDGSIAKVAGGIDDGDKGDITVSNDGATFTIDNNAVTTGKFESFSQNRILGRIASGSGDATQLTAANVRTMINVADGATNVTNTNQLTNGAGFITATLTNEQVQDIVGGMVTGNTESGITVTYQDGDGTLDFSVASQTDQNFTTTLKNKLDGIASGATNVTNTNQLTNGAGFITATLTNEQVQDIVGGMVSGNTESGITVTYQDGDGTLDFSVASQTDNNFTNADHSKLDSLSATSITSGSTSVSVASSSISNTVSGTERLAIGTGGISVTGSILVSSTVDGRDIASDGTKLDGIESGATADQSASEILTAIKTVDGASSGLDADMLDGLHAATFLRGDTDDTMSGNLTINGRLDIGDGSGNDTEIRIYKGDNNVSDHIQFYNGTTRVGEIGVEDSSWLRINQETANNIYTPRYIRADGGFFVDSTSKGINGSGNFIGGTIAGASDYDTLLRSDTADTASGDITFSGGAGAVSIAENSDIRFANGTWTGNSCKIQQHGNALYIQGGSNSSYNIIFRSNSGTDRLYMNASGDLYPATDSAIDLGSSSKRFQVGYFDELDSAEVRVNNGILETKAAIATSHTLTADYNALAVSPTINNGVTVTVPSGAVWAIV